MNCPWLVFTMILLNTRKDKLLQVVDGTGNKKIFSLAEHVRVGVQCGTSIFIRMAFKEIVKINL